MYVCLFSKERHQTLEPLTWDASRVKQGIDFIFQNNENNFHEQHLWAAHPDDLYYDGQTGPFLDLYMGAAGVMWAQNQLAKKGYGALSRSYLPYLESFHNNQFPRIKSDLHDFNCENIHEYKTGLLLGDAGFLATKLAFAPQQTTLEALYNHIQNSHGNAINEYMWGDAGCLALFLAYHQHFDQKAVESVVQKRLRTFKSALKPHELMDCEFWEQNLYGSMRNYLGSVHGFAGNAFSILKALPFLDESAEWKIRIRKTIKATAITKDGFANWPTTMDELQTPKQDLLLQFCHGAPGMISCLSSLMNEGDQDFDDLMINGGHLIYHAGPLTKGSNICHGTAGNGFALLKLFSVTNDQMWLERARQFAMAALYQCENRYRDMGQHRYSLWTGDAGLALFLDACLHAHSDIPTMDYF